MSNSGLMATWEENTINWLCLCDIINKLTSILSLNIIIFIIKMSIILIKVINIIYYNITFNHSTFLLHVKTANIGNIKVTLAL